MHEPIRFVVPGDPVAWQRAGRGRQGQTFTPKATRVAKAAIAWSYHAAGGRMLEGPVYLECVFYLAGRRVYSLPESDPRDVDNLLKLVADALEGVAYPNDRRIVGCDARKLIDRENPRTAIAVMCHEEKV